MERRDFIASSKGKLSAIERLQVRAIRRTLRPGSLDRTLRWCQRNIGAQWIHLATKNLRHSHHLERVPKFEPNQSFLVVANHRSFFDLYVITCELIRRGISQRIVFPVRSNFFYDNPLGLVVNGMTSFFAMYPPVFRDANRASLNLLGLDELVALLGRGGVLVGLHPEGRRNLDADPYQLLPAQSGVGRLIRLARVPVIPVFINGLSAENLGQQVKGNFTGSGTAIHTVYGAPIDFGDLLDKPRSPHLFKQIAERTLAEITRLGAEEKELRARAELE